MIVCLELAFDLCDELLELGLLLVKWDHHVAYVVEHAHRVFESHRVAILLERLEKLGDVCVRDAFFLSLCEDWRRKNRR